MNELEQLEQQFSSRIRLSMDQLLPVPDSSRLLDIEQDMNLEKPVNRRWLIWIAVLLGLTGISVAYWYQSQQKVPIQDEIKVITPENTPTRDIPALMHQHLDQQGEPNSPVIYQQEVISDE